MKRELKTFRSTNLDRYMDMLVYGEKGWPLIAFATQDSPCTNFEDFGLVDTMADYIEGGQIQLFCVSNVDKQTWSDEHGDKDARAHLLEAYYRYVFEELVPYVQKVNASKLRPLTMGCSMGATHSVICALRRPDLFQGCIALSGVYDAHYFFGDWMSPELYLNSPTDFVPNMSADHPLIPVYNQRQLVLCVGRGAWEDEGIRTQGILADAFARLGINAWCDFWGQDVNHDWPWWKKQIRYFMPLVLEDAKKGGE